MDQSAVGQRQAARDPLVHGQNPRAFPFVPQASSMRPEIDETGGCRPVCIVPHRFVQRGQDAPEQVLSTHDDVPPTSAGKPAGRFPRRRARSMNLDRLRALFIRDDG